ncbi:Sodium-dependent dopamine transporter [Gryllus bimaculatus]|nr:Sodium-dependent dopamine transporter [Gryllus bimaculatus]
MQCSQLGEKEDGMEMNLTRRTKTPADEFFHNGILEMSGSIAEPGGLVWPLVLCDALSWIALFLCIMNGVKSVGKVVYFTATFPFVILFVLLVRGVTLPGAVDGILFYISPQWEQLTNLKVWADAAIQIFFSLGPGWGGIVNMASYNEFKNDNKWDSVLVPVMNCGTSIFAGFVVFSVLGFMSHQTGVPVSTVATGGPGLAFVTYPEAITMLPWPHLWAFLFFVMLYLLGMDSCFVQIEAIISSVTDEFIILRKHKRLVTFCSCCAMFLGSLSCVTNGGMYMLQLLDWYSASISVILICIVEVVIVGWIYGCENFVRDVEFMIGKKVSLWWKLCWKYITPIILTFIFITSIAFNTPVSYNNIQYPKWAISLGWMSAAASMVWIPIYILYKIKITPGTWRKKLLSNLQPTEEWGPESPENRREWELQKSKKNTS